LCTFDNTEFARRKWVSYEALGLPLAADGRTVDMIFLLTIYNRELLRGPGRE
jgi:hypothetical protein